MAVFPGGAIFLTVFAYNLIVAGSVEERMLALQRRKRHLADSILAPGGTELSSRASCR